MCEAPIARRDRARSSGYQGFLTQDVSALSPSTTGTPTTSGAIWRMLRNGRASAGNGGVGGGCTTLWGCSTAIECAATGRKSPRQDRSNKPRREANEGAQCGKSARCIRRGGGWKRGTASALNRRASPRPYRRAGPPRRPRSPRQSGESGQPPPSGRHSVHNQSALPRAGFIDTVVR